MPDLPTITVSNAQANRILDTFKAKFNTNTQAETAQAYRAWLSRLIRSEVLAYEAELFDLSRDADKQTHLDTVTSELPAELPFPDTV